ncbi:beta-galactosidase-like [Sipha flava]|uniref:Beta-galactosidase n=1 Tax=Sipha flava TaxID=143950 RepID=A0A2S2QWP1_9HEMI|nr:beta-galactosidase-like [Sipha flava]
MYTITSFFILTLVLKLLIINFDSVCGVQKFYIDYEKNEFIKDDKVFRYASGSLHYFRVPRPYWRDRIRKMKAAGLNAVSSYVEWSFHEPTSGVYNFEGQADLEHFLTVLKEENMLVLLRPGPYISAERDFGGFPYWLLKEKPSLQLRSNDPNYTKYVKRWFSVLMPKIVPFLYGNEGNIIMVQIENEYGHNGFDVCDKEYTLWLRDLLRNYVGDKAQLYTTDECNIFYMKCGHIPNVYSTVDFSPTVNMTECFGYMKEVQKKGPLVNSEFYTGWIAYWNQTRPDRYSKDIIQGLKYFLSNNISFNLFPFHGGTNFGFSSGATTVGSTLETAGYLPQLTSYDFKAPLDEAGDPTNKYYDIQRVLKEANHPTTSTPRRAPKGNYGIVNLLPVVSLFDQTSMHIKPVINEVPLSFEDMDINHGLVLYETNLPTIARPTKLPLIIEKLRDRAIIFLDCVKIGTMSRSNGDTSMEVPITNNNKKLNILVENQGRINSLKFLKDKKGILSNVTLGKNILGPWVMTGYPLNDTSWLEFENLQPNVKPPAYYRGIFIIPQDHRHSKPLDTYLDTSGWSKGIAFINNINIGRYWPQVGPQITLYVPAPYLVSGLNTIVMVEFERAPEDFTVKLVDKPRLDW